MRSSIRSSPSKWSAVALCSAGGVASCSRETPLQSPQCPTEKRGCGCHLPSQIPNSRIMIQRNKQNSILLASQGGIHILTCWRSTNWYGRWNTGGLVLLPFLCTLTARYALLWGGCSDALLWMGNWQEFREGCVHGFCSCVLHFLHCVTVCWNWNSYKYWNKPQAGGGCKERPRSMC